MQRGERGPVSADVGIGQRISDLATVTDTLTQRHDRTRRGQMLRPHLHRGPGEHRLRADLHQHRAAQRRNGTNALGELHRLAGMPPPILRIQRGFRRQDGAGAVADQWQRRHRVLELACERLELTEHRVQQLRVEGVAGFQPRAAHPVLAKLGDDLLEVFSWTRKHGVGAVVRPDRHLRKFAGNLLDELGVGEYRHHPSARGQTAEQPSALGHQPHTVFEAEHPGDACRRVLTHTVPQDHIGLDAPRLPQSGQTHFDRKQRRLRK